MSEAALRTLKEIRKEMNLSMQKTADRLGINISSYNRLEKGETQPTEDTYKKIVALFGEEVFIQPRRNKPPIRQAKHYKAKPQQEEKMTFETREKKFLKTCWNMRDALSGGRMIVRDIVDATYEYMENYEAVTYLYKWSQMGFYHFIKGGVIDQGYFIWDKLPPEYRRVVQKYEQGVFSRKSRSGS